MSRLGRMAGQANSLDRLGPICKLNPVPERAVSNQKTPKKTAKRAAAAGNRAKPVFADMSTAEATVATLLSHGINTVYALPGVHNDHLFDAFQRRDELANDLLRLRDRNRIRIVIG